MRMSSGVICTTLCLAALGAWGCRDSEPRRQERVYVQPAPQYVEQQPQYVIVQQAPPPMRVERRPPPPSGAHVWIDGYWGWENQRYVWQQGRYEVPPRPDVIWVAPRYENDPHGVRYTPGQWSRGNPGEGRGRGRGN